MAFTKLQKVVFLRIVRRRGDDVVAVAAMRARSHNDARFRTVGSHDVVTIAGNRLDIPDDGRYVQLLGRFVGICSNPHVRDAMIPVLVRGVLRDTNNPPFRHRFLLFPPPQIFAE
jgi:hypothetical protein